MRFERSLQADVAIEDCCPGYIDLAPRVKLPLRYDKEARLLGHFCNLVIRRLALMRDKERSAQKWVMSA
ncbi:MAG: hypothetical protein M0Q99_12795 [Candidatus Cloacimonetes bacterium]|nr:hypothetical protein [Candidatus Cloacimonadota bacterium]